MNRYDKVIFVSTSGTCRSLWATALFEKYKANNDLIAESRGQVVLFEEPANPKAVAIAKSKGIEIDNKLSQLLTSNDFGDRTIVFVMTEEMKKKIYDDYEDALNVYSIKEFVGIDDDIEPAYGGELSEYGENFEKLERIIKLLICKLETEA